MGVDLEEHRRSRLHSAVHGLLSDSAVNLRLSAQLEQVIEAVFLVVRGACAEFSETWNSRHACALTRRLPVEVTTECLRAADFKTRVRASHISRRWRAVALADCRLWTNLRTAPFSSPEDQNVALHRLEHMIRRSRPLPVRLQIPHSAYGDYITYAERVFSTIRFDMHRLEEYNGPAGLLEEEIPLSLLTSLNLSDISCQDDSLFIPDRFPAQRVPNLRRLVAPALNFPPDFQPYGSLQHLVCHLRRHRVSEHLFRCCPNLLTAELLDIYDDTELPLGPLPRSLQQLTLRVPDGFLEYADFSAVLQPWLGARIPRLSLFRSCDVEPLIPIFLAAHDLPVKLVSYHDDSEADIILTTVPASEFRWEIGTVAFWHSFDCFEEFRVLCAERLTALSIPLIHLWACFDVETHAPHLVDLEVRLAGREEVGFPWKGPEHGFFLRAAQLRRIIFDIADSYSDCTMPIHKTTIFETLNSEFRSLIVYDADLLDSITVHCAARHLEEFSSYDISRFAKMYHIDTQ